MKHLRLANADGPLLGAARELPTSSMCHIFIDWGSCGAVDECGLDFGDCGGKDACLIDY